jgi:ketosteroid isomerase-like protein
MADKIQVLKERYQYFAERDLERTLDLWTDDFVWEGDDAGLPGSGRHEGKQASIAVLIEAASALDKLDLDPQEFFENGDTAVVVGYQDIAKDGRSARVPFVHIWRFRGNQICGVRLVLDTLTTAKVFGTT